MDNSDHQQSDHDLLITLHSEVRGLRKDIKDLTDGSATKLDDHEGRIRRLEFWGALGIGGLYVLNLILGLWVALHH